MNLATFYCITAHNWNNHIRSHSGVPARNPFPSLDLSSAKVAFSHISLGAIRAQPPTTWCHPVFSSIVTVGAPSLADSLSHRPFGLPPRAPTPSAEWVKWNLAGDAERQPPTRPKPWPLPVARATSPIFLLEFQLALYLLPGRYPPVQLQQVEPT